jgi:hypothetical protein
LLKNPAIGKMPAMASVAQRNVQKVTGSLLARPPMRRRSCSPLRAWITEPLPRNSRALKKACVIRWKIPAANAPTPQASIMYPSWLTVEYARTFLMSFCVKAMVAAKMAVSAPTPAMTCIATGLRTYRKFKRAIR